VVSTRSDLPGGTVTLLFTDIEGSTKLLHALGQRYAGVLAGHHSLLRETFRARGGVEVDTAGDALFYVFAEAPAAVLASADAQRALSAHRWPDGYVVRVRMGIHTGEPMRSDEGYVGIDLHQGARLMAAAAGGQVLVGATTAARAAQSLPSDTFLIDLGDHLLKDFSAPQRIFQLAAPGLETEFPPPRTLSARFVNIPTLSGALVGRDEEVTAVVALFAGEHERLVTLTGPGGTGKTSLALRAGAELLDVTADGVVFCDLSPVTEPALLLSAVARALNLRESGGVPAVETIVAFIAHKQLLLILDNLEQLLDGVAVISQLLEECPRLLVLATSRAPLRLAAERQFPVNPLSPADALELLTVRARDADPDFSLVASLREQAVSLCRRLDHLPLAIELAAARLRLFALPELLERLDRRMALLTSGRRDAPARQQTLRATLDWSYNLLNEAERRTLARVAVFSGAFTVEAAEGVCDATIDGLASLVEQSLLRRLATGRLMLLETIREYSLERLAQDGAEHELHRRHADWFIALAERHAPALKGNAQAAALDFLDSELDDLQSATRFLLDTHDIDGALRLASSIWIFWESRRPAEGRRMLEACLEHLADANAHLAAEGLWATQILLFLDGDMDRARQLAEEALKTFHALGDEAWSLSSAIALGWIAAATGRADEALEIAREALISLKCVSEPWARGEALNYAGSTIAVIGGEMNLGRSLLEEAGAIYEATGNDQRAGGVFGNLGWLAMAEGQFALARTHHVRSIQLVRKTGDSYRLYTALGNLALVEVLTGNLERARPLVRENLEIQRERGERRPAGEALITAAAILIREDCTSAMRILGAGEGMYGSEGREMSPFERTIVTEHVLPSVPATAAEACASARAEGRAMAASDAIEVALTALVQRNHSGAATATPPGNAQISSRIPSYGSAPATELPD
jgi:predicted ATPase/class 3 adenylate cyclase